MTDVQKDAVEAVALGLVNHDRAEHGMNPISWGDLSFSDQLIYEGRALAAIAALPAASEQEQEEEPLMVPRYATDAMMQAGLYHMPDSVEWADLFTAWHAMFDCLALDAGATAKLPPAPSDQEKLEAEALGWAKATAWHKHGIAWHHLEQISRDELLAEARARQIGGA